MSTFDLLGDLSPTERTLTRILLRNANMNEKAIFEAVSELPEDKRMSKEDMQDALKSLIEKGWIEEVRSGFRKSYAIKQKKHR